MKECYKYDDGILEIIDYDDDYKKTTIKREYQDNIEDILCLENEIEHLEMNKKLLLEDIEEFNNEFKYLNKRKRGTALRTCVIPLVITYIIDYINLNFGLNIFNDIFSNISIDETKIITFVLSYALVNYVHKMISYHLDEKELNNGLKVLNLDIELLNEMLEKRKNKLETLNNIKQKINEKELNTNRYINVNYKEQLRELKNDLRIYNELTNRYDEFLKYYNNNCLEENLQNEFNGYEIDMIKKYYKTKTKRK